MFIYVLHVQELREIHFHSGKGSGGGHTNIKQEVVLHQHSAVLR